MPREFSVQLRDTRDIGISALPFVYSLSGLVEPLGINPSYMTDLYRFYRYMRVTAVQIQATLVNTGTTPLNFVQAVIPFTDYSALSSTDERLEEIPDATFKLVSPGGGMDRAVISRTYDVLNTIGNLATDKYWIDGTQAVSTTPLDSQEPVIVTGVSAATSGNATGTIRIFLVYHVQFFDLRPTANT